MLKLRLASVLALLLLGLFSFHGLALANHEHHGDRDDEHGFTDENAFTAVMSGEQEVPPTDSPAQGTASFLLSSDEQSLYYAVEVTGATSPVTMAHIHLGRPGENGPVVATLCSAATTPCGTEGVIAQGTITAASLQGPLAGHPLSDLIDAMRAGETYTNVHTTTYPDGEIRGQIGAAAGDLDED